MNIRISRGMKLGLTREHAAILARLRTPSQVQDYVSAMPTNFEVDGDSCLSVAEALRQQKAHCAEGAFIAACALWINGQKPLLMDMQAMGGDDDHVVALFRHGRYWGAISKTNHIWLRWRDPIYRSLRELAMSYFHEYVLGPAKTLWKYSRPFYLRRMDPKLWVTNPDHCWDVTEALDLSPHFPLVTRAQARRLRQRDEFEIRAGQFVEFKAPNRASTLRY